MALIQDGGGNGTSTGVDATHKALRTSDRPNEALTWINIGAPTGLITTLAAGAAIFSLRNTGANIILVRRVGVGFICTTAFTTAQRVEFGMQVARGFSASDTGGTAITITGNNGKMRTSLPAPTGLDCRIATTAALSAGTKTLDANMLAIQAAHVSGVGTMLTPGGIGTDNLMRHDPGDYPLVLATNEGFNIVNNFLMGAAGVGIAYVNFEFAEASSY